MVSWMHNTAIDINNIGREYNHRGHKGTQRNTEDRFKNSVLSVSSVVKSGGFYRLCWIDSTTTIICYNCYNRSRLIFSDPITIVWRIRSRRHGPDRRNWEDPSKDISILLIKT